MGWQTNDAGHQLAPEESLMPIIYRCKECGHILAEVRGGQTYETITAFELYYHLHGKCPGCGRELLTKGDEIQINPLPT